MSEDGFLSRWSRRKAAVQGGEVPAAEVPLAPSTAPRVTPQAAVALPVEASAAGSVATPQPQPQPQPQPPPLTMDDVALLTPESSYARFVAPSVDPGVRNAAMKKLFTDPHYNLMDGLDTYIDDYGIADPIPESMLRQMVQSKALGLFDHEDKEPAAEQPPAVVLPPQGEASPVADITSAVELTTVMTLPTTPR